MTKIMTEPPTNGEQDHITEAEPSSANFLKSHIFNDFTTIHPFVQREH